MTKKSPISTLIALAEKDTDDAAKNLGKAIRAHEETEKQLALLLQYRDDYVIRFQDGAAGGLSAGQYMNFQSFIYKLDSAVDGQKKIVKDAEFRVTKARNQWQENEKKRLSYGILQNRAKTEVLKKESKQDQKQTDEHATRSYFYKS
ncbi:flagellar export protein FliJ [Undibacterium sp. Jales W-56]|uniref:flagellar export protein FliJ n=1 Tax=Undibacterium sp. Jales W-56 TaxID=2897325 RepID=UPI0021CE018A|nr:flagellar export protein FliJ [Undibacterium sp. Jales W-56]MCU6435390.1 flagellar export protein FliJ [Undibacterium sp. Jales W-56]